MCADHSDSDYYLRKLVGFLAGQSGVGDLTLEDLTPTRSRAELGIGSLQIILLMANYGTEVHGDVTFQPEWVARLEDVNGIVSVMREIDSLVLAPAGAS